MRARLAIIRSQFHFYNFLHHPPSVRGFSAVSAGVTTVNRWHSIWFEMQEFGGEKTHQKYFAMHCIIRETETPCRDFMVLFVKQNNFFFQIWITGCVRMRKNNTTLVHRGKEISQRWRNQRARRNARDTRFRRAGPTHRLHAPGNSPGWGILHQGNHLLLRKDIRDVDGENSRTIQTTERTPWATLRRPVKTKKS